MQPPSSHLFSARAEIKKPDLPTRYSILAFCSYCGHTQTWQKCTAITSRPSDSEYSKVPPLLYWRARGTIEYTEGGMFWTFMMTGAIHTFTTEAEAKSGFLQQAQKWVDDRLGS